MSDEADLKAAWARLTRSREWGRAAQCLMNDGRWMLAGMTPEFAVTFPPSPMPIEVTLRTGVAKAERMGPEQPGRFVVKASFNPDQGPWHDVGRIN